MQRRSVLRACGAVGVAGLAGCGSRGEVTDDEDDAGSASRTTAEGTPTTTAAPPTLVETTIGGRGDILWGGERRGERHLRVGETTVAVDGTIGAPNPCHTPTVDAVSYDDEADRLSLTVGVESGDTICTECIGDLPYTVTTTFEGGLPGRVVVDHAGVESPVADETDEE
ncbi:hypothetical protein GJ629_08185 [Halapricum sp. CBA1109]|uniref:hypothetical protein n=1 Tax=Halapricum sp. CBA1109 TaxID=2668068 RepID=UPI0012FAF202|nr:hypothetical protein [Halapricum sp. CBA1109]MUV89875.1 hypothetical protein [Halapricum sp. CBA1109]